MSSYDFKDGNLAQARSCIEQAHTIFETSLGPDHPDTQRAARSLEQLQASNTVAALGDPSHHELGHHLVRPCSCCRLS